MRASHRFVWLLVLGLALGCGRPEPATKVGIVQFVEDPQLDLARQGVIEELAAAGFAESDSFGIIFLNAQGELGNLPLILDQFRARHVRLIVTIPTPSTVAAAKAIKDIPIVFTVCSPPDEVGIPAATPNLYGYFNPLDLDPFLALVRECVPGIRCVGHVYNPAEINAVFAGGRLTRACTAAGLRLEQVTVANVNDAPAAVQALAGRGAQCIVVSADNMLYSGLAAVSKTAAAVKLPVFVTDPCIVGNGAALGYGLDYFEWGSLSGKMAVQLLKGEKPAEPVVRPDTDYRLYVNRRACEEQGLVLPEKVKARVAKYY